MSSILPKLLNFFTRWISTKLLPSQAANGPLDERGLRDRDLLAFKTIMSILVQLLRSNLSVFKAEDYFYVDSKKRLNTQGRRMVKVYDTFACLVVLQHEVIAVTTNFMTVNQDQSQDKDKTLEVVAISSSKPASEIEFEPESETGTWSVCLAMNPFKKLKKEKEGQPTYNIVNAIPLVGIGKMDVLAYMEELQSHWVTPSLKEHLWLLSNALIMKSSEDINKGRHEHGSRLVQIITRYIASASYKKVHRWFNNEDLSKLYLQALKAVNPIPELSQATHLPQDTSKRDTNRHEIESDQLFMQDVILMYSKHEDNLKAKVPRLIAMAKSKVSKDENFQLYTNDTRHEFHALLLEFLDGFGQALDELMVQGAINGDSGLFKQASADLYRHGYALLRISRGHAYKMHLNNIAPYLYPSVSESVPGSIMLMGEVLDEERDNAMDAIKATHQAAAQKPADSKMLAETFVTWLRLMVSQFDAVEIVTKFVTAPTFNYTSVSAQLIVAAQPNRDTLPWKVLLDEFIPGSSGINEYKITNAKIIKFLKMNTFKANIVKYLWTTLEKVADPYEKDCNRKVVPALLDLKARLTTLEKDLEQQIAAHKPPELNSRKQQPPPPPYPPLDILRQQFAYVSPIAEKCVTITANLIHKDPMKAKKGLSDYVEWHTSLTAMSAMQRFFCNLQSTKMFPGTLHCEAYLASLLPHYIEGYMTKGSGESYPPGLEDMKHYGGWEIGVLKRCCPVCGIFLQALLRSDEASPPFAVRGTHNTISACALPPWTPLPVVKELNKLFGDILQADLVSLMNTASSGRQRSMTTSSDALSYQSDSTSGGAFTSHPHLVDTLPSATL